MPRKEIKLCRANPRQMRSPSSRHPQTRHSPARGIVPEHVRRDRFSDPCRPRRKPDGALQAFLIDVVPAVLAGKRVDRELAGGKDILPRP